MTHYATNSKSSLTTGEVKCKELQVLKHHTSDVAALDFGAKFHLASVSSDKSIAVWEWTPGLGYTQTPYSPLLSHNYAITKVKFCPDGNSFVTAAYDGNIIHWNLKDGSIMNSFVQTNNSAVRSICFVSKQQKLLSGGDDGHICVWNLNRILSDSSWQGHEEAVSTLAISPDEQCLVSSDLTSQTKVWTVSGQDSPTLLCAVPAVHELGTNEISFSKRYDVQEDSSRQYKLVSCGNDDNLIKLWSLFYDINKGYVTLEPVATLQGHTSAVSSVGFNNASTLIVSGSMDKTVKLWDLQSLSCIKTLESHTRYVTCCTFSCDDSLLASGSNDKTITVWDVKGTLSVNAALTYCCASHSECWFNSPEDGRLLHLVDKFSGLGNAINSVDIVRDKYLVAGGSDKNIYVWTSTASNSGPGGWGPLPSSPLSPHQYAVHQVEFSRDASMLVSCSLDGCALVFDVKDSEFILRGSVHIGSNMRCARFSTDTRLLATGGDDETVTVWRTDDLSLIMTMNDHAEAITCLGFSSDSRFLVSGCVRGNYRVWGMSPIISLCLCLMEDAHDMGVTYIEFSPDLGDGTSNAVYTFVTCGNDALIKVWLLTVLSEVKVQCDQLRTLRGHGADVTCVKYIQNNIIVSSSVDKTLRFWNQDTGDTLHVLDTKDSPLTSVAFSPLPPLLVSGSLDKSVLVWSLNPRILTRSSSTQDSTQTTLAPNSVQLDQVEFRLAIPHEFLCPITHQLMRDPVLCSDGFSYDRAAIELWISSGKVSSPLTNKPLMSTEFIANTELSNRIQEFIDNSMNS
uniref:Uncharacterized WD repeat-containing protein alr3466 n=1 Tax=Cacopsylla melanoneura TaxID=428564 RepID=A0A8D8RZP7_9HEMI